MRGVAASLLLLARPLQDRGAACGLPRPNLLQLLLRFCGVGAWGGSCGASTGSSSIKTVRTYRLLMLFL